MLPANQMYLKKRHFAGMELFIWSESKRTSREATDCKKFVKTLIRKKNEELMNLKNSCSFEGFESCKRFSCEINREFIEITILESKAIVFLEKSFLLMDDNHRIHGLSIRKNQLDRGLLHIGVKHFFEMKRLVFKKKVLSENVLNYEHAQHTFSIFKMVMDDYLEEYRNTQDIWTQEDEKLKQLENTLPAASEILQLCNFFSQKTPEEEAYVARITNLREVVFKKKLLGNQVEVDIKRGLLPENIMLISQKCHEIKLIDFGLARYYDGNQDLKFMAGTPEFAAPEVIKYESLDYHTDMWSIGVITYILLSGYSPFLGDTLGETYCNVEKGEWSFTEEFDIISEEAKDFITKLLVYNKE